MIADLSTLLARASRHKQPLPFLVVSNLPIALAAIGACEKAKRPFVIILDAAAHPLESALLERLKASGIEAAFMHADHVEAALEKQGAVLLEGAPEAKAVRDVPAGQAVVIGVAHRTNAALHTAVLAGATGVLFAEELAQAYTAGLRTALHDRELSDPAVYEAKGGLAVASRLEHFLSDHTNR